MERPKWIPLDLFIEGTWLLLMSFQSLQRFKSQIERNYLLRPFKSIYWGDQTTRNRSRRKRAQNYFFVFAGKMIYQFWTWERRDNFERYKLAKCNLGDSRGNWQHLLISNINVAIKNPTTKCGRILASASIFFILIATVSFCVETLPQFQNSENESEIIPPWDSANKGRT